MEWRVTEPLTNQREKLREPPHAYKNTKFTNIQIHYRKEICKHANYWMKSGESINISATKERGCASYHTHTKYTKFTNTHIQKYTIERKYAKM